MNLEEYKDQETLIITPSNYKYDLLKKNHNLYNIKYMTKEDFKNHYFFSYDNKTIDYLISKYDKPLEFCKIILNNLYIIDTNKEYKNSKLKFLKEVKIDLINNNLLYFDSLFKNYIKRKKIVVYNYNVLDKYEEEMFKDAIIIKDAIKPIDNKVIKCKTLEDEVLYVIEEVLKLYKNGISLEKIYIAGVTTDYLYTINRLFSYFNIPVNIDMRESIYGTSIVNEYLKNKQIPNINNNVVKKLINVVNSLVDIEDSSSYDLFLIDALKNTYCTPKKYNNAINIINDVRSVSDDSYLFVVGLNQDVLPKTYKDEEYISDNIKDEVSLYKTKDKNKLERDNFLRIISNTNNLYLSYKEKSNFNEFLPSSIISDLNMKVIEYTPSITNSNLYNKLVLGQKLDMYYKYREIDVNLKRLVSHYDIDYNTYNNKFSGINTDSFIKYINNFLRVSYTSLNSYNLCGFKYYVNYILKVDPYKANFSVVIGNLFHYIFSIMDKVGFDFSKEWNDYVEKQELNISEKFFLENLRQSLLDSIKIIEKQELLTNYKNKFYEKEITLKLDKKIDVLFNGKIDKIMYKNEFGKTCVSLIDYKTGSINTNIYYMKYGLNMQLVIYLYLIYKSNLFTNLNFTGMYLQKVLYSKYTFDKSKTLDDILKDNLKLQGYSTCLTDRLSDFDKSYEKSELIKGMKINKDLSFASHAKILSDDDFNNILNYTEKKINQTVDSIIEAKFNIDPKVIDNKNLACENCKYMDVCFRSNKDLVYLEKVENLDFLGDEKYG